MRGFLNVGLTRLAPSRQGPLWDAKHQKTTFRKIYSYVPHSLCMEQPSRGRILGRILHSTQLEEATHWAALQHAPCLPKYLINIIGLYS